MPKNRSDASSKKAKSSPARVKSRKEGVFRYLILALLFLSVIGFYTVRLISLQLTVPEGTTVTIGGEKISVTRRYVNVKARRGSILDTNGVPLVQDHLRYQLELDGASFPKDDAAANELIFTAVIVQRDHKFTTVVRINYADFVGRCQVSLDAHTTARVDKPGIAFRQFHGKTGRD